MADLTLLYAEDVLLSFTETRVRGKESVRSAQSKLQTDAN